MHVCFSFSNKPFKFLTGFLTCNMFNLLVHNIHQFCSSKTIFYCL
jgi:hypothetical protein